MKYKVVTPPAEEPLVLADCTAQLNSPPSADDSFITGLIGDAREYLENMTGRSFITQTLDVWFPRFLRKMDMPRPPLVSVESVKYLDTAGDEQTLDTAVYRVNNKGDEKASILLKYGQAWPDIYPERDADDLVTVRIVTGYGAAAAVPRSIKRAMLLIVGDWYMNREAVVPQIMLRQIPNGVHALLSDYFENA